MKPPPMTWDNFRSGIEIPADPWAGRTKAVQRGDKARGMNGRKPKIKRRTV
jgi:hypothetical protein